MTEFLFARAGSMLFAFDGETLYIRIHNPKWGVSKGSKSWDAQVTSQGRKVRG